MHSVNHHQARRRVPANAAGARGQVGRDDGAQAQRPDLAVVGATDGSGGLAEGRGGAGEQERPHPVGGAGQGAAIRPEPCVGQAAEACLGRADPGRLKGLPDSE